MSHGFTRYTARRLIAVLIIFGSLISWFLVNPANYQHLPVESSSNTGEEFQYLALTILDSLKVQPESNDGNYDRSEFYTSWSYYEGCDMRNVILARDLSNVILEGCLVLSGELADPYTGQTINFIRGSNTSSAIQIDHVVALSNAWATGAAQFNFELRHSLSQDPLNLLAVSGPANQDKSGQDASMWLPSNVAFQCQYVARQISVKYKYALWVTNAEKSSMQNVLKTCPSEPTLGLENL